MCVVDWNGVFFSLPFLSILPSYISFFLSYFLLSSIPPLLPSLDPSLLSFYLLSFLSSYLNSQTASSHGLVLALCKSSLGSFGFEDKDENKDEVLKFSIQCLHQIVTMSRLLKNFVVFTSKFWASIFIGNSWSKCKNIKPPSTLNIFFMIG